MTVPVTDVRSNPKDQIAHAANVLGRSKDRIAVFVEIHTGRKRVKTAAEIARTIRLKRKRVLEEAKKLVHKQIVKQTERDGDVAYERDGFYYAHKHKIVSLAKNPRRLRAFPTKYSPRATAVVVSTIRVPRALVRTRTVTIDDIDSFSRARRIRRTPGTIKMRESLFKKGIQRMLGESGRFKDWGGETSDLFTTRVRLKGSRRPAALAFKGQATRGVLTPGRMGRNGDQIQRLFAEDAEVFLVQYGGQIASSVLQQMAAFAQAKSLATGKKIFYGVVDGPDSARIVAGYRSAFKSST